MAAIRNEPRLDDLPTEERDPAGADLDLRSTRELVRLMGEADATVPHAVAAAEEALAGAIDEIAARLARGGRLVYVGAGTSGRLALVDAVECQSTFGLDPGRVVALVAGGADSTATAQEHAEDDAEAGAAEVKAVAAQDGRTVRSLVEEGLRKLLAERAGAPQVRTMRDATFTGTGMHPEFADAPWEAFGELLYGSPRVDH